jgi:hypothetical protein
MRDSEHKYKYIIYPTIKNNKLTYENWKLIMPPIKFQQILVARSKCKYIYIYIYKKPTNALF